MALAHAIHQRLLGKDGQADSARMLLVTRRCKQSANGRSSTGQTDAVNALAEAATVASVLLWSIEHAVGEDVIVRIHVDGGLLVCEHLLLLLLECRYGVRICLLLRILGHILKRHLIEIHGQGIAAAGIEDCRRRRGVVSMVTKMDTVLCIRASGSWSR